MYHKGPALAGVKLVVREAFRALGIRVALSGHLRNVGGQIHVNFLYSRCC